MSPLQHWQKWYSIIDSIQAKLILTKEDVYPLER